jgi:hypothetical protein
MYLIASHAAFPWVIGLKRLKIRLLMPDKKLQTHFVPPPGLAALVAVFL